MPYIPKAERPYYDDLIDQITDKLLNKFPGENGKGFSEGDLNYVISSIAWNLFNVSPSYRRANLLDGVLGCVKQEFYRRKVAPYEDEKIKQNGDICQPRKSKKKCNCSKDVKSTTPTLKG